MGSTSYTVDLVMNTAMADAIPDLARMADKRVQILEGGSWDAVKSEIVENGGQVLSSERVRAFGDG